MCCVSADTDVLVVSVCHLHSAELCNPSVVSYPVNHAHVLIRAAEVPGEVGDAEGLVLTRVNPSFVLRRPRDPVEEDPERLPHGLLTN